MKFLILIIVLLQVACNVSQSAKNDNNKPSVIADRTATSKSDTSDKATGLTKNHSSLNTRIREVDFKNFIYDWFPVWDDNTPKGKVIKLNNGEMEIDAPSGNYPPEGFSFSSVEYGDLTGDGVEDAVIVIGIQWRGAIRSYCTFVYAFSGDKLKKLWVYETGDKAHNGFHGIRIEEGKLILELYKPDTVMLNEKEVTIESSSMFTRDYYQWVKDKFTKIKTEEIPTYPDDPNPWVVKSKSDRK